MKSNLSNRGVSVVCVAVRSRPMFPELVCFEDEVVRFSTKLANMLFANLRASRRKVLSSVPQFDLFVLVAMMFLAAA